jgi:hypothetical protein
MSRLPIEVGSFKEMLRILGCHLKLAPNTLAAFGKRDITKVKQWATESECNPAFSKIIHAPGWSSVILQVTCEISAQSKCICGS